MTLEFFIASRYLRSKRKPFFASFLLWISFLAVTSGVFALIFVLSVMNGFELDFRRRVLSFKAPLSVYSDSDEAFSDPAFLEDLMKTDPRIVRLLPFAEGEAVLRTETGNTAGIRVRGISEPPQASRFEQLNESDDFSEDSVVLGDELALTLRVFPDSGPEDSEKVRLVFPIGDVGPTGDLIPRVRVLKLTGLFHSGFYDYDSKYALAPFREVLRLLGGEARTGLEVWTKDSGSEAMTEGIQRTLRDRLSRTGRTWRVLSWKDENPKLFQAMKLEKIGMFVLLGILLLIASFNIFGFASLLVLDKSSDMAILRSSGFPRSRVRGVFLWCAGILGSAGALFGGVAAVAVSLILQRYPIRLPSSYYLQYLPVKPDPWGISFVVAFVPLLTILAAFYPSLQATRPSPVEILRHH